MPVLPKIYLKNIIITVIIVFNSICFNVDCAHADRDTHRVRYSAVIQDDIIVTILITGTRIDCNIIFFIFLRSKRGNQ